MVVIRGQNLLYSKCPAWIHTVLWSVCFLNQVLQSWLQGLPDDYAVKDLINEIKDWIEDEYVKETVWKRLQNCVAPGLLPTFSERVHKRKCSDSSSPEPKRKAASSAAGKKLNRQVEGRELGPNQLLSSNPFPWEIESFVQNYHPETK